MWLAVLLLAVAQQDKTYVRWLGVHKSRAKRLRASISTDAQEFVSSLKFDELCQRADIEPGRLRSMKPHEAFDAYQKLTKNDFFDEVGKEIDELD